MVPVPKHNQIKFRGKLNKSNDLRTRKGFKPLNRCTFYLDIRNQSLSSKIESKIKELGGNIDLFLVKDVTHVITDSAVDPCATDSQLANISLSSSFHSPAQSPVIKSIESSASPGTAKSSGRLRPKSRADAMLECARHNQSPEICEDNSQYQVIDLARTLKIPVWHVEKVLKYLDRIASSTKTSNSKFLLPNDEPRKLLGPHLKVESLEREFRPCYKYLRNWPALNTSGALGECPFKVFKKKELDCRQPIRDQKPNICFNEDTRRNRTCAKDLNRPQYNLNKQSPEHKKKICAAPNKMTRKTRQRIHRKETTGPQCGYCEICHVDYQDLASHARSEEHLNYVRNDSNFVTLDSLISAGANVDAFLKLNESSNSGMTKCNGFGRRSLRGVVKPQEANGMKNSYIDSNFSEMNFNIGHSKASRKSSDQSVVQNGYETSNANDRHRLRSRAQLSIPNNLLGTTAEDICKSPKSNSPKESRSIKISSCIKSEDDMPLDILRNTKIKGIRWRCPSPEARHVIPASPSYKIVGTRLKSKEPETKSSEKGPGLVVKFKRIRQSELTVLSDEAENFMFPRRDDASDSDSDYKDSSIINNIKVYSDESDTDADYTLPSSKLLGTNDDLSMRCTRKRVLDNNIPANSLVDEDDIRLSDIKNEQRFRSSPTQPLNEINVGDRVGITNNANIFADDVEKLIFSFECIPNELWYHTYRRQDENKEFTFENFKSRCSNGKRYRLPYELGPLPPLKPNCCRLNLVTSSTDTSSNIPCFEKKIRRHRRIFPMNGKSRKSPREHASTLASLVQQRKKGEIVNCGHSSELTSVTEEGCSMNSTPIHQSEISENIEDPLILDQHIDSLLSDVYDNKTCFDIGDTLEEGICLNIRYEPTVNNLLESLSESTTLEESGYKDLSMSTTKNYGRLRKKRKNNKTGWPKKKKFLPRVSKEEKLFINSADTSGDSFVNAATQTSNCELANDEIVLSIPVTDNGINIVELSGDPLVVCAEHIDSCSNTTDSGKENHCQNDKSVIFDSADIFSKCLNKRTGLKYADLSITTSDNFDNHNKIRTENVLENVCISASSSDDGQESNIEAWGENLGAIVPLGNMYKDEDSVSEDRKFQPFVCVQKIDEPNNARRLRSSSSPQQSHNKRRQMSCHSSSPVGTLSPRKLRAPRGRWYRER